MSILARIQMLGVHALYVYSGMGLALGCGAFVNCNDKGLVLLGTSFLFILYVNLSVKEEARMYMSKNLILLSIASLIFLGIVGTRPKVGITGVQFSMLALLTVAIIFVGRKIKFPYSNVLGKKMVAPGIAIGVLTLQEILVLLLNK